MATAGSIVIDLLMKTGAFETDSKRAEKRLKELQKTAKQFGVAVGAAVVTAGTALAAVTMQAIQFADQVDEMSQRLGVSTEQLSGWAYAAKLSGTSFESLTNALPKLSKNLAAAQAEGSRMGELFDALGIKTTDAAGNLRDVEDILPELADRFKTLDNDTLEAALAMELFGRSGAEMLEFLNRGSDGIKELTDRAAELGIVIGSDTAANAAEFNDRMDDLKAVATSLGLQVADRLLPAMIDLVEQFSALAREGELAEGIADGIGSTFDVVAKSATVLHATVKGVVFDLIALAKVAEGLSRLGPGAMLGWVDGQSAGEAFRGAGVARDMANEQGSRIGAVFGTSPAAATPLPGQGTGRRGGAARWSDSTRAANSDAGLERRLGDYLDATTDKPKKAGSSKKSEAEMEAERLQQAYDSLSESLERQQFMLGKTGEAAQVRYEIELGSLQALTPELQNELLTKAALLDAEIAAREEAEKAEELDKRATEAFEDMNGSILEQIKLIGMSADEQEIWNALTWAGVEAESARGLELSANLKRLQQLREEASEQIEAMDTIRDAAKGFLQDLRDGGNPLEALEDALDRIIERLSDQVFDNLIDGLFGKKGDPGGGSFGDALGSIFGSMFGGGKAGGGDVIAGRGYLIGEQGPEMFVPRTSGSIVPSGETSTRMGGGGSTVVVNNAFNMPGRYDMRTQAQIAVDVARSQRRQTARGTA